MTAKPAPELTPIVLGLARELFITDWRIAPAQASPIPARTAPAARGILTLYIRSDVTSLVGLCVSAYIISDAFNATLPSIMLINTDTASRTVRIAM